jgi:hypothetical protein
MKRPIPSRVDEMTISDPDDRLTRYLTGDLGEPERTALEHEFFTDPLTFDRLVHAEHALVDDYVRGRLPASLAAAFKRHYFAHPRLRVRVEFAEALKAAADATPGARRPWLDRLSRDGPTLPLATAAAIALLVALSAWMLVQNRRLRGDLARSETTRSIADARERTLQGQLADARRAATELSGEVDRLRAEPRRPYRPAAVPSIVSLLLTVSGVRSSDTGAPKTVRVLPGTMAVRVQLVLGERAYPTYAFTVKQIGGGDVFSSGRLRPEGTAARARVGATIPAKRLPRGDYLLTLAGERAGGTRDEVSQILFRVDRP